MSTYQKICKNDRTVTTAKLQWEPTQFEFYFQFLKAKTKIFPQQNSNCVKFILLGKWQKMGFYIINTSQTEPCDQICIFQKVYDHARLSLKFEKYVRFWRNGSIFFSFFICFLIFCRNFKTKIKINSLQDKM